MNETRKARLASVIQEELSILIRELKDPRVPFVTVTRVEVTDDGSQATAYMLLLGQMEGGQALVDALEGLTSAAGFLRRGLAKVLTVRHIPVLLFKEDKGLANSTRVHELLKQIESTSPTPVTTPTGEGEK